MEALANRESCLMCWPFLPMMAPTAWAGMNTCTISCSGACCQDRGDSLPKAQGVGQGRTQEPLYWAAIQPPKVTDADT